MLIKIIEHFRNTPEFVELLFDDFHAFVEQFNKDLLENYIFNVLNIDDEAEIKRLRNKISRE